MVVTPVRGKWVFLHCFEQRALRFRRGTIHLIYQYTVKIAARNERQSVARPDQKWNYREYRPEAGACELDTSEIEGERASQCLRESRFANAGNILDKQVAAGEKAGDGSFTASVLANDDFANLSCECIEPILHAKTIRRIDAVRKPS